MDPAPPSTSTTSTVASTTSVDPGLVATGEVKVEFGEWSCVELPAPRESVQIPCSEIGDFSIRVFHDRIEVTPASLDYVFGVQVLFAGSIVCVTKGYHAPGTGPAEDICRYIRRLADDPVPVAALERDEEADKVVLWLSDVDVDGLGEELRVRGCDPEHPSFWVAATRRVDGRELFVEPPIHNRQQLGRYVLARILDCAEEQSSDS